VFHTHSTEELDHTAVRFHCPLCGRRDVLGVAWREREVIRYLGLLPLPALDNYWIRGECCGAKAICSVPPGELSEWDADAIESRRLVRRYVSIVKLTLLLAALLLCWTPAMGAVLTLIAWLACRNERGWVRWAIRIAIVVQCVVLAFLTFVVIGLNLGLLH
jgi:hypothetical protein